MSKENKDIEYGMEKDGTFPDLDCLNDSEIDFISIRKLKARHRDYRPGRVKIYTDEEIEEWLSNKKP